MSIHTLLSPNTFLILELALLGVTFVWWRRVTNKARYRERYQALLLKARS